ITMGEGWHNNHHYYPASTRQGFYWWEVDMTYYCLKMMEKVGLVWDIRDVPNYVREGKSKQDTLTA
ncbi:MAG: acyl-CoA desaturase, partial [Nitrospirota bacterium]